MRLRSGIPAGAGLLAPLCRQDVLREVVGGGLPVVSSVQNLLGLLDAVTPLLL